jgi:hypothetical protein
MPGGEVDSLLAAAGGGWKVPRAVEIAADVTRALEHAHSRGIVHRDLKPANILIDDDGRARLGDFGLATTEARSRVSGGTLVGTVAYLPPEQALGEWPARERPLLARGPALTRCSPDSLRSRATTRCRSSASTSTRTRCLRPATTPRSPSARPSRARPAREAPRGQTRRRGRGAGRLLAALTAAPAEAPEREVNPLEALAGGVFVGRERELERLREAVDSMLAGRGSLQLLVGEPGIGKTRAAEELATYARVSGARVYWGRAREDEGAPAYWPWVQAIRLRARCRSGRLAWQLGAAPPRSPS